MAGGGKASFNLPGIVPFEIEQTDKCLTPEGVVHVSNGHPLIRPQTGIFYVRESCI